MSQLRRRDLPALFGAGFAQSSRALAARNAPNIVLMTGDHLRWNHIAANGNAAIHTPRMDALAANGVSFTSCCTVGVACAPNRASLMTGRYPNAHRLMVNGIRMPEDEVTITHLLRGAGYYTGQMGKLHFWPHSGSRNHREPQPMYGFHQMRLSDEPGCYDDAFGLWLDAQGPEVRRKARVAMPADRGKFDYYTFAGDEKTTHAHWVSSETARFIDENKGRPFFVHAGFYAPHPPLNPPASMLALYKDVKLPPRIYRDGEARDLPPIMRKAAQALADTPEATWTAYRTHFYAMVSELDRNIGRIVDSVEAAGLTDRTVFVMTADHGDYLGDHNMSGKSAIPYDGAMRVPLIFSGPGIPRGGRSAELCELVDVAPTLLELAGVPLPPGNQGTSQIPVMRGGKGKDLTYMQSPNNRILRTRQALYCYWANGEEVLFDLERDPNELRNIAQNPEAKGLLDEMRMRIMCKAIAAADPLPERIAPY
jgi:arylsulfatase